jgi:hypothetical protein
VTSKKTIPIKGQASPEGPQSGSKLKRGRGAQIRLPQKARERKKRARRSLAEHYLGFGPKTSNTDHDQGLSLKTSKPDHELDLSLKGLNPDHDLGLSLKPTNLDHDLGLSLKGLNLNSDLGLSAKPRGLDLIPVLSDLGPRPGHERSYRAVGSLAGRESALPMGQDLSPKREQKDVPGPEASLKSDLEPANDEKGESLRTKAVLSTLALTLALLVALGFFAPLAKADCPGTSQSSREIIAQKTQRLEESNAFPEVGAKRSAMNSCLAALNDLTVTVSPILIPISDLNQITEGLCQEGREFILNSLPSEVSSIVQSSGRKVFTRNRDVAGEVRDALK